MCSNYIGKKTVVESPTTTKNGHRNCTKTMSIAPRNSQTPPIPTFADNVLL